MALICVHICAHSRRLSPPEVSKHHVYFTTSTLGTPLAYTTEYPTKRAHHSQGWDAKLLASVPRECGIWSQGCRAQ